MLGGPEWILHYYAWDKVKLIASIQTTENPMSKVHSISVNPQDGTLICVLGEDFLKFYRYAEGELKQIPTKHVTGVRKFVVAAKKNNFQTSFY